MHPLPRPFPLHSFSPCSTHAASFTWGGQRLLTYSRSSSKSCLLIQTPVAPSVLIENILTVCFFQIFIPFILIFVVQVQKHWRKWQKLNSAAKGKNLIFKYVSFSVTVVADSVPEHSSWFSFIHCSFPSVSLTDLFVVVASCWHS